MSNEADQRMTALGVMRQKAFDVGGALGSVMSKTFELVMRVVGVGIEDEVTINHALESLENERTLSIRYDANANERLNEVVYGLTDSVAVMVEELLAKQRRSLGLPPAVRDSTNDTNTNSRAGEQTPHSATGVSPANSSEDSSNDETLPLFAPVKEEPIETQNMRQEVEEARARARATSQKASNSQPVNPSSSRRKSHAPQSQKMDTPLSASGNRSSSVVRPVRIPVSSQQIPSDTASVTPTAGPFTAHAHTVRKQKTPHLAASAHRSPSSTRPVSSQPQAVSRLPIFSYDRRDRDQDEVDEQPSSSTTSKRRRLQGKVADRDVEEGDELHGAEPCRGSTSGIPKYPPWICDRCGEEFDTRDARKLHNGEHCKTCKKLVRYDEMDEHMEEHRLEAEYEAEVEVESDPEYTPPGLSKGARRKSVSRARTTSVKPSGPCKCNLCAKSFDSPRGLGIHMASHKATDTRKRFICDQKDCSVFRNSYLQLKYHKRDVHDILPYECSCGVTFRMSTEIQEHMKRLGHKKAKKSGQIAQPASSDVSRDASAGTDQSVQPESSTVSNEERAGTSNT